MHQESMKRQNKANNIRYALNILFFKINDFKVDSPHNNVHSVQRLPLRDRAVIFFCYLPANNALSPSHADARKTV